MYRYVRSASIAVTAFGAVVNLALAVQVFTASSTIKWEPESEWEASSESWQLDVVKVVWGLCCAHFTLAAAVCFVGFIGILKKKSSLVRFYRDYSIADFSLCALVTALASYAVFHASVRAATCEEISHHPELLRSLIDMGLNLENCERWLERGGLAFVVLMSIILVIRLHFLLAVSNMYSQLVRNVHLSSRLRLQGVHTARRIYLLPPFEEEAQIGDDVELVYAPIPISSIPKHIRDAASEAWVSRSVPMSTQDCLSQTRSESHVQSCEQQGQQQQNPRSHWHRSHSRGHSSSHRHPRSSATLTGAIRLPIVPDEGLLPSYHNISKS